jgi:integrase
MSKARRHGSVGAHRGRWRVRITIDGKQRSAGVYETRDEAEDVLAALLAQAGPSPSVTLKGFGAGWLDDRERHGMHRDVSSDRSRWHCYIEEQPWATEPIEALASKTIRAWVRDLIAKGKARQTVKNALNLLRACLEGAVEAELIDTNPARGVLVPKVARTDDPWTHLTPKEIDHLLTHASLPAYQRAVFAFAIYTGAREGEIFGLHWRDVHIDDRKVVFRYSWRGPRKNGKVLTVPLLEPAIAVLREWRRIRPGLPSALVFAADDGSMHTKGYDAQWADRWRAETGTRADVRFHDFRHTAAASLVSEAWGRPWRLEEVRDFLGHSTIKMTERYGHLAPGAIHDAARRTPGARKAVNSGPRISRHTEATKTQKDEKK